MSRALVLNATGKVSSAAVDALVTRGVDVVAASRNPAGHRPHVTSVRFDYADPATYAAALDGVDRVFWVAPPLVLDSHALVRPFLDRALGQVRRVVAMTAAGVEHSDAIPLRQVELAIERSGVPHVHLRPTWFMDNFHTFWAGSIQQAGVIALPAGAGRTAFIDARDIGAAAAAALVTESVRGALTLTGPEAWTYEEAAQVLGAAAERSIGYVPVEDDAFIAAAAGVGIAAAYAALLVGGFQAVRAGLAPPVTTAVAELTGAPARTLAAYARDHAAAWRVAPAR